MALVSVISRFLTKAFRSVSAKINSGATGTKSARRLTCYFLTLV